MQKTRKRKHPPSQQLKPQTKPKLLKPTTATNEQEPFPTHLRPTPQDCTAIRDSLLGHHGFPPEFAKYRRDRPSRCHDDVCMPLSEESELEESVLDGLVKTVLSQNTTEVNSLRAFSNLKSAFPCWEDVLAAEPKSVENAIRCGGLAPRKTSCILNLLSCLLERKGKLCLEYLRSLSVDQVKAELSLFKGIGPKTVSCVLMFNLQHDDFPVDTHVSSIPRYLKCVPSQADRNKTYIHLNQRIPDDLKFDLNCLLYTHGKLCKRCTKKGSDHKRKESGDVSCPLLSFCSNFTVSAADKLEHSIPI
ncbi:Putative DNA glycosylase At3g47830 [Linum grandiflorum]